MFNYIKKLFNKTKCSKFKQGCLIIDENGCRYDLNDPKCRKIIKEQIEEFSKIKT